MRIWKPSFWSLVFPIGIIVYSGYKMFIMWARFGIGFGAEYTVPWVFAAAIVLGGILPIILTFAMKTETREYCLPRVIIFVCTIGAVNIPQEFVAMPDGAVIILYAVSSAITLLYFYKYHKTRFSEWNIIFLSTPQIYMMAYYLLLSNDTMVLF